MSKSNNDREREISDIVYNPAVFDIESIEQARDIILLPEAGMTSHHRWQTETPYLMELIERTLKPVRNQVVLDFGCGIGRLSKPLVYKHLLRVVGVDTSANMLAFAHSCVANERFMGIPPHMLPLLGHPFADHAVAIWALQHCLNLEEAIDQIYEALVQGGELFVVNNFNRAVPIKHERFHWADDHKDVKKLLSSRFDQIAVGSLVHPDIAKEVRDNTFWGHYRKV